MQKVINAYDQIAKLDQAEEWLIEKGMKPGNTRFSRAKKWLCEGVAAGEIGKEKMVRFQWATQELDDYLQLYEFLRNVTHRNFIDKLERSLKGPDENKNEDKDKGASMAGRNYMFELVMAAKFAQLGFEVSFDGKADVILSSNEMTIHVECKQALGKNMDNLLEEAFKQIRRRCDHALVKKSQFGIGVIGLTRYISQESNINGPLVADSEYLGKLLKEIISKMNFSYFRKKFPQGIGVITHLALPYWKSDDMTLAVLRRFDFHQLLPDGHEAVQLVKKIWTT